MCFKQEDSKVQSASWEFTLDLACNTEQGVGHKSGRGCQLDTGADVHSEVMGMMGIGLRAWGQWWKWSESVKSKLLSYVWLFAAPCTIQSMEFSRPEYWSG